MTARKEPERARGLWERIPGSGIWWVRYRDASGQLRREKVGRRSDAIKLLDKRRTERVAGVKLPESIRKAGVKFSELADAIETFSETHHRDRRNVIARLGKLRSDFDNRVADTIKPEEIDAWLSKNTSTPATANRYRALFSLVFREGLRNGKVKSNPARLVRQRKEENGVIRWLKDDEEKKLRGVVPTIHLPELDIALGTGMRLSEQYGLKWANVDLERKEIRLPKTKNGSARSIPMNQSVFAAFQTLRLGAGKVKPGDQVFNSRQREWWESVREQASLSDYRWHDHRHTFCSRLAMRGVNLKVIQTLAGHKTIAMTARYAHLDDASLRTAVDLLPSS